MEETNLRKQLLNKVVLVTGAAGSIGSEIVRQLTHFNPSLIVLFDQAESPLYDIELELKEECGSRIIKSRSGMYVMRAGWKESLKHIIPISYIMRLLISTSL